MKTPHPTGIRPIDEGWQAYIRVRGRLYSKRFPRATTIQIMKDWRQRKAVAVKTGAGTLEDDDGDDPFGAMVDRYLTTIDSMPSVKDRRLHMREWAMRFRGRDPVRVTALEIRAALETYIKQGYQPGTVNRRRTALMSCYTRTYGKTGYNPVRDVPKYHEEIQPRAQAMGTAYRILACMGPSKSRARLRVLLWTGWPHKQIAALTPEHLNFATGQAYVSARRKGKGKAGVWLPLLPGAIVALQAFVQAEAFGRFSSSSCRQAFLRGLATLNAHRARLHLAPIAMRPYDFRHIFGTWLAERTTDDRAIQELMRHATAAQTRRYTEAATAERVWRAVGQIAGTVAEPVAGPIPAGTLKPDNALRRHTLRP